jgi:uncharacterized protein (TIRG00374 family)
VATGLAILLTIAAVIVSAWKWQLLLRAVDQDVSLFRLSDAYLVGLFFNNFLPSNIGGDVARAHAIGRHTGRLGIVVASIAGERLLAGLALGATASVALVVRQDLVGVVGSGVGAVMFGFIALTALFSIPQIRGYLIRRLGQSGRRGSIARSVESLGRTLSDPWTVVAVFALSVVFQGLVVAVAWAGFMAVGAPVSIGVCFVLIPVISAIQLVPVSLGGFGVREGAYAFLFGQCCAIAPTAAIASSLVFAGVVMGVSLVGGVRFAMTWATNHEMANPELASLPDLDRLRPVVNRVARETWFNPDWLWNFCRSMHSAGLSTDQTIAALTRQGDANRLPRLKRALRRVQLWAFALRGSPSAG